MQDEWILLDELQAYSIEQNPLGLYTMRAPLLRARLSRIFDSFMSKPAQANQAEKSGSGAKPALAKVCDGSLYTACCKSVVCREKS